MKSKRLTHTLIGGGFAAALLCSGSLAAQDSLNLDPMLNPGLQPPPRTVYGSPPGLQSGPLGEKHAWGTVQGGTWIGASQFTVSLTSNAPNLNYAGNFFFDTGSGTTTSRRYYAQLELEPGLLISHLSCDYNDSSSTANVGFQWYKYTTDFNTGNTTAETIDSFVSSGTPGVTFDFLDAPAGGETMHIYLPGADDLVNHYIAVDVTGVTSFAGCFVFWHRQVSPAPGTATFNDVPTSDPFFRSVEALAASGITGGCGGGNFCPNSAVTREQMAAFLARALGLNWQF